jgi:hypothetical protein
MYNYKEDSMAGIGTPIIGGRDRPDGLEKGDSSFDCSSCLPSVPSFGSFFRNRTLAVIKIVVSAITVGSAVASLLPPFCCFGGTKERARRCLLAVGTTLQGLRQFFYTTNREGDGRLFCDKFRAILQIGNIPAAAKGEEDLRPGMIGSEVICHVWKGIFFPGISNKAEDTDVKTSAVVEAPPEVASRHRVAPRNYDTFNPNHFNDSDNESDTDT